MCRENEQVSDLPKLGEPQRSRNIHRDRKTDEPATLFSDENAEAPRTEVLVQPGRGSEGIGSLAVVSAILIEDLGECFDFPARRGSQSPNSDQIVGGPRNGMVVLTHGCLDDNRIAGLQQLRLGQCSRMTPDDGALSQRSSVSGSWASEWIG